MAKVTIKDGALDVRFSMLDAFLTFQGSFHIPLSHVTNAYVSDLHDLELKHNIMGLNLGSIKSAGVFSSDKGMIFADVAGKDCLVIETRGERFPRIALQLDDADPNDLAHEIVRAIPAD